MPRNPVLFPDNFVLDGSISDSGIGALEVAVNNLSVASKFGAMRQANAIRISGLGSIKNQNRGMPTLNSLLPTRSVGKFTIAPSEPTGTVGYFIGGLYLNAAKDTQLNSNRVDRFTFATDTIVNLGAQYTIHMAYAFGNSVYGYYCWAPNGVQFFGRFTYQTETTVPIGSVLFPSRYLGASLKSQNRGYACCGISSSGGTLYGKIDRFSFAGEVCVSIATTLQAKSYVSGFGNKFNGYVGGGSLNTAISSVANNIERFSYATELSALIAAVFSIGRAQLATWTPSSLTSAYLMSGYAIGPFPTGGSPAKGYYTNTIDKFNYTGETCGALGITLTRGLGVYGAVGNNTRCVIGGGYSYSDGYTTQGVVQSALNELTAFTYTSETSTVLGSVLSQGRDHLFALDNHGL